MWLGGVWVSCCCWEHLAVSRGAGNGSRPDSGGAAQIWDEVFRAGAVWVIVKLLCALGLWLPALKFTPKGTFLLWSCMDPAGSCRNDSMMGAALRNHPWDPGLE